MIKRYFAKCPTCNAIFIYVPKYVEGKPVAICPLCDAPSAHLELETMQQLEDYLKTLEGGSPTSGL